LASVPATEFKAKCLELMDRVAERRESFVITKRGKPVARLVPVELEPRDSIFGWLRDRATVVGNITRPALPPEAWETLKEWDELNVAERPQRRRHGQGAAAARRKRR
jgi:prevent-host-death family protein